MTEIILYCERCCRPVTDICGWRDPFADRVVLTIRCHGAEQELSISGPEIIQAGSVGALSESLYDQLTILHARPTLSPNAAWEK